jgi:hypothetical protein
MDYSELVKICRSPDYKTKFLDSKTKGTCILCDMPARRFRDKSAELEYSISALCQTCQDTLYSGKYKTGDVY